MEGRGRSIDPGLLTVRSSSSLAAVAALLLLLSGCGEEIGGEGQPVSDGAGTVASDLTTGGSEADDRPAEVDATPGRSFSRPENIRGIYLNAWASGSSRRSHELIELARRTEVNAFVIDIKDASGYVSYPTTVDLAQEIGADQEIRIPNVHRLLDSLSAAGIWPIARIVVFKDPILAAARSDMAIQDSLGATWIDGRGDVWVNPWDRRVWDYHVDLAREAIELGFQEIQWDYIRFPDRPASELSSAVFPGSEGRPRTQAVREFLLYTRDRLEDLDVPLTGDVFGVTTTFRNDTGIGQVWEQFADLLDASLPMVYPSHYWEGSFGFSEPNAHPYEVIHAALTSAVERSALLPGAGKVIPWLQDFTLGAPAYGIPEVRAQIEAVYDAGLSEWILWNASSRYTEGALEPAGGWPGGMKPEIRGGPDSQLSAGAGTQGGSDESPLTSNEPPATGEPPGSRSASENTRGQPAGGR